MNNKGRETNRIEVIFDWYLQSVHESHDVSPLKKLLKNETRYLKKTKRKEFLKKWILKNQELKKVDEISSNLREILNIK